MHGEIVLSVKDIHKKFPGTKALDSMQFDLYRGEALALVGENGAGKSTLMNIISGVFPADSGSIELFGRQVSVSSTRQAQDLGIGFVHQELSTCAHLTVAENVFAGRLQQFCGKSGLINYKKLNEVTQQHLNQFGSRVRPNQKMRTLKTADQQVVEIIKSLVLDCKIIIFDEPTSSLTEKETQTLFGFIRQLKSRGISIIYISHRMEEIFELCERVVVMRDGCYIDTLETTKTTSEEIVTKMVGRTITNLYPPKNKQLGPVVFEVRNLSMSGLFQDINFAVRAGEIVGFAGLVGAGRTEMACGLCGLIGRESGELLLKGQPVAIKNYAQAIQHGIAYLTEDRKQQGLFLKMDVKKNICCTNLDKITTGGIVNDSMATSFGAEFIEKLNIKVSGLSQKVGSLSGGNQQKIMIAKWLYTEPKVIIMDEPTRGIDVGAKSEIHMMLRQLANSGIAVLIISSELPEIIGVCDRVLVMHEGKLTGELQDDTLTEENIIRLATAV